MIDGAPGHGAAPQCVE